MNSRMLLSIAGVVGALGIVVGAFGAHSLPAILKDLPEPDLLERRDWLETGVKYHMYHAAALLALAIAGERWNGAFTFSAILWLAGIAIFSGCLYAMSLTGIRILGAIVPLGGLAFILGWAMLLFSGWKAR